MLKKIRDVINFVAGILLIWFWCILLKQTMEDRQSLPYCWGFIGLYSRIELSVRDQCWLVVVDYGHHRG